MHSPQVEVLHNAHPKRNIGSPKRGLIRLIRLGYSLDGKSSKPINVVHMSSTFASDVYDPMIVIEKEVFICQWTTKTGQGSGLFSKRNARKENKRF